MSEILRYVMDHNKFHNMMHTSDYLNAPRACWLVGMFFVLGLGRSPAQENNARIVRGDGGQVLASASTKSSPYTKNWLRGPRPAEPQLQAAGCRIDAMCGCQIFWPRHRWCNICGIVVLTRTCGLRLSIATFSYKCGARFKLGVGHRLVPGCHPRRGT